VVGRNRRYGRALLWNMMAAVILERLMNLYVDSQDVTPIMYIGAMYFTCLSSCLYLDK